ncbi:hypothetical protein ACTFIW_005398 [Dictyostelium discoideum]
MSELNEEQINNLNYLFWKVFKNKILFKQIFKASSFKLGIYSYYECNKYEWIVRNGYLELLKDKVFRNDKNLIIDKNYMFTVFKTDNQSFFSILFKNYSHLVFEKVEKSSSNLVESTINSYGSLDISGYLSNDNLKSNEKNRFQLDQIQISKNTIELIIKNNNLSAFQVITNENIKYEPTFSDLVGSINYGSFDISKYILNNYSNEFNKFQTDQIWEISIGYKYLKNDLNLVTSKDIELYIKKCNFFFSNILNNGSSIKLTIPEPPKIEYERIYPIELYKNIKNLPKSKNNKFVRAKFLNKILYPIDNNPDNYPQSKEINKNLKKLRDIYRGIIYELSVDLIINICLNILNILKYQNLSFEFSNEFLPSFIIKENELNNMKLKYSFSNSSISCTDFDSNNQDIKRLLIMVVYFTRDINNYDFILMKYFNNETNNENLLPIDFAIYNEKRLTIPVSPFKYCKIDDNDNNGEKIKNYIKKSIQSINDQSINQNKKYSKNQLLEICFKFDDLSLIEMVYNEFQNDFNFPSLETFENIKSIKVFDYVFNKLLNNNNNNNNDYLDILQYIICNKFDLASYFKLNYSTYYYLSIERFSILFFKKKLHYESMEFVYNNFFDFSNDQFDQFQNLHQLVHHYLNYNKKEIHRLSNLLKNESSFNLLKYGNPAVLFYQLNYLYDYNFDKFNQCFQFVPINKKFYFYYLKGELKEMLLNGNLTIETYIEPFNYSTIFLILIIEIKDRNDLETKNFLLNFYSNNQSVFDYLCKNLI